MHIDYVDANSSQSINSKISKSQFDTLDCSLAKLAVLELVAKNPSIKQQEIVELMERGMVSGK